MGHRRHFNKTQFLLSGWNSGMVFLRTAEDSGFRACFATTPPGQLLITANGGLLGCDQ